MDTDPVIPTDRLPSPPDAKASLPPPLAVAIVGGGHGCETILQMVEHDTLGSFRMRVLGVVDVDPEAAGMRLAREIGIPLVTTDRHELYRIDGLDAIIELTGSDEVRDQIERERPRHVRLIDHFGARLFWELHQAEQEVITRRTETRRRIEAERARIAQILDSIPDEILVLDTDQVIQDANSSFLLNNRLAIDQVRGLRCYEVEQGIRGECQVAVANCPFFTIMRERRPVGLVRKHFDADGNARFAAIVGAPMLDSEGEVVGMVEMTRDISHRILLEEELAASEVRLQQLMKLAPLATWVKNRAGQYSDVNPATCELLDLPANQILGKTDLEILPREAANALRAGDRKAWSRGEAVSIDAEAELGGRDVRLTMVKFPILDLQGNPTALFGLAKDVTAQVAAEEKLTETRKYLDNILDHSPVIIFTADLDGRITSFNRGAQDTLGYEQAEALGRPAENLYQEPEQRTEFLKSVSVGQAVRDTNVELLRSDGTPVTVSLTLSQLRDADGEMIGTVAIAKDISHRTALMRQIVQSERMAAVGRLAAGVAHEINNPLAIVSEIIGYLEDMLGTGNDVPCEVLLGELREALPKVRKQVVRGRSITRRLLSFARKSEARLEFTDVNASLDEILAFLEKEARLANVTIHRQFADGLPPVAVEEMQLGEVFINLVTNAFHALQEQDAGQVWIVTEQRGDDVVVTVRDDGPGVDPSVCDNLFDPFVSTKPVGQGTGLGLSICYGIVKRFDGDIRLASKPGEGAEFEVILPTHPSEPDGPPDA